MKARTVEDRKKVTSKEVEIAGGAKRAFGDDFVERVKLLSDSLELNELVCADLLWKADSSKVRYAHTNLLEIAESLFFEARQSTLKTLQMLFTARQNAQHAGDAGILIAQFTTELLDSGLLTKLIDTIANSLNLEEKEFAPRSATQTTPNTISPAQWDHQRTERHMVAELIFTIAYTTAISPPQALQLLKLVRAVSSKCSASPYDVMQLHGLYHTSFSLIASMIVVLDVCNEHTVLDVRGDQTRPLLLHDTKFIQDFNELLLEAAAWESTGGPASKLVAAQSTLKLAWASFLRQTIKIRRSDPLLAPAQQLFREEKMDFLLKNLSPSFLYLTGVLRSDLFENDKNFKATYVEVFDELVRAFLTTSGLKAREMKSDEENGMRDEMAYQQFKVGPVPPKTQRSFDHFLRLLSALYRSQPLLASRYWNEDYPALVHFVRGAGDNLYESNFVSYLTMIASLASGEQCALNVFRFLQERSRKYINWDYFFDALHQYYLDFQEPEEDDALYYDYSGRLPTRMMRQISPDEVESLEAILQVTHSALKGNHLVRKEMLVHPTWRVLYALFHLLTCPVPVSLKASLTNTISQFARDSSAHFVIWQYLDAVQLIGSSGASSSSMDTQKSMKSGSSASGLSGGIGGGANGANAQAGGGSGSASASSSMPGIVSGGGILFELSEIESKEETYPYTLAFLDLLNRLLTRHYYESRDTLADVNLWPYVQFVMKEVFQRFDQRAYKTAQEKWHIARACLRFFLAILRDSVDAFSFSEQTFSQNSYSSRLEGGNSALGGGSTSASSLPMGSKAEISNLAAKLAIARYGAATLRLYRYFLSRTDLLSKVISIVCSEGQADLLITTREASKDSSLEDCVRYALMILETVLLRQAPILSTHLSNYSFLEENILATSQQQRSDKSTQPRRLRIADENTSILVPLHTILLRNPSDLASLALYVKYPYNSNIARLSVSIVHLLSRDTDKLALILHDQGVAQDFVNGYIDKLEMEDTPSRNQDQVHYRGGESSSNSPLSLISSDVSGEDGDEDDSQYWASRAPSIREAILALLLECACQPEYNLTQLLFGMNPSESSRIGHHSSYSFNRHLERAAGGPKKGETASSGSLSVLPTILSLLGTVHLSASHPKLCSFMYELLYTLLKRPTEFGGVCRALRSAEFFRRQFDILDVSLSSSSVANHLIYASEQQSLLLPQQPQESGASAGELEQQALQQLEQELYGPLMEQRAWLLKSIALELHTTSGTNRTYTTHLLEALFTTQTPANFSGGLKPTLIDNPGKKRLTSANSQESTSSNMMNMAGAHQDAAGNAIGNGNAAGGISKQQRMKMRELLDALEIPLVEPLPLLQGSLYFSKQSTPVDISTNGKTVDLTQCTEADSRGFSAVDLRLLYGQLVASQSQIRADYTLSPEQSNDMISEETVIMRRAVAWNRFQQVLMAQYHILESWRHVLEVALIECYHLLDANSKEIVLYELLETLLSRLNHPDLRLQVGHPLTSCILMLTAKIRQLTYPVHMAKLRSIEDSLEATNSDPSSHGSHAPNRPSALTEEILSTSSPNYLPVEQLLVVHKGLIAALLRQGTSLLMRGDLYGALLNYLQFTQRSSAEVVLIASSNSFGDFWTSEDDANIASLTQQQHQQRQLYLGTLQHLYSVAERLMEVIAGDASDAPHLFQSIGFAVLDALCTYERGIHGQASVASVSTKWLAYLTRQGLLRFFLESLVQHDDALLSDVLLPTADSLNDLYVFESKMAALLSMASTAEGAQNLVEAGLLSELVKFTCIDHPHQAFVSDSRMAVADAGRESWLKPVHERYEQILAPVLRLVVAVLTQLPRNEDVATQVLDFVEAHSELISILLKDRAPEPTHASLQQLCFLSSLFYHLSLHGGLLSARPQLHTNKLEQSLAQLFAKYSALLLEQAQLHQQSSSREVSSSASQMQQEAAALAESKQLILRNDLFTLVGTLSALLRRLSLTSSGNPHGDSANNSSIHPTHTSVEIALQRHTKTLFTPVIDGFVVPSSASTSSVGSSSTRFSATSKKRGASAAAVSSGRDFPPLSVLVQCLHACLERIEEIKEESIRTIKRLQTVHQCKTEELILTIRKATTLHANTGVFGLDTDVDALSIEKSTTLQLQQAVQHILGSKLADLRFATCTLYQIAENALFVLWRHLSFFLSDEDLATNANASAFLLTGNNNKQKVDKSALSKDATQAISPLFSRLSQLPPLSTHQIHIIPAFVQRVKDVLEVQ